MPTKENGAAELDGAQAARFWTPWLAAYTGARFTEIVRLRREDCRRKEEGWAVVLGHAKKTRWCRRLVPLHPHLLELGFASFAESRPGGPLFLSRGPDDEASYARLAGAVSWGSKPRSQQPCAFHIGDAKSRGGPC